jgi:polyribonucleotide 5'-hydroxyl-kinase
MQPLLVDLTAPRSGLLNAFLALLAPPAADEAERYDEEVLDLHVLGFIVVCVIVAYSLE